MIKETQFGERIAKVLARAGVASRRGAERLIFEGRVAIDGRVLTTPAEKVEPGNQITLDGKPIAAAEPTRLWLYYKPVGLITSHSDPRARPTVFEKLPADLPRVLSVGRLDLNSEGLLLLTNDGALERHLELPSTGWARRYRVRAYGRPEAERAESLGCGVTVDGVRYAPAEVKVESQKGANCWLSVTLKEGKNREVRRLLEHIGLQVNRLIRTSYGPFQLGGMKAGEVKEVPRKMLRQQIGQRFEGFGISSDAER